MDGHQDAANKTKVLEALCPYVENPLQIVIRNEAFVVVAAMILFVQLMLGPKRRRSGHWVIQGTLWVAYTVAFPLITYTLGQMVTSPVKSPLYPIWAVIVAWAAGCANAFMAYNIEDNKRWKRYLFELLQYYVYLVIIFKLITAGGRVSSQPIIAPLALLTSVVLSANVYRVAAGWMVTNSTPSKLLADHMRTQVKVNTRSRAAQEEEDSTMESCKYTVWLSFLRPDKTPDRDGALTMEAIWAMTFDDDNQLKGQLRDVCLSFALSQLLRRCYFGLDCAEAGLPKTLKFALEVLLPAKDEGNHYSGAFR